MVERAEWRKALWIRKQIGELIQEGGQEVATVTAVRGGVWLWTPLHWTWWSWRQNTMVRLEKSQSIGPSERSQSQPRTTPKPPRGMAKRSIMNSSLSM